MLIHQYLIRIIIDERHPNDHVVQPDAMLDEMKVFIADDHLETYRYFDWNQRDLLGCDFREEYYRSFLDYSLQQYAIPIDDWL